MEANTAARVAFIGLGTMGLPIAKHIVSVGVEVHAFDPAPTARATASAAGIMMAGSIKECVVGLDAVFMMLPTVATAEQAVHEVIEATSPGTVLVELGTIGRENAVRHSRLAEDRDLRYLDAPVINGGQQGAVNGSLRILAGGATDVVDAVRWCLDSFTTDVVHLGEVGAGQAVKMVHNTLLAVISCGTAEALSLARDLGLDPAEVAEVFQQSSVRSFALEWLFPPALAGDFSGGAKVDILRKDLHLTMGEALNAGATAPLARLATDIYERCSDVGYGDLDMSVVLEAYLQEQVPQYADADVRS